MTIMCEKLRKVAKTPDIDRWTYAPTLLLNRSMVTRLVALALTLRILSSSTSKTLSQVPVVHKVVEEDRRMLLAIVANELESITHPDGTIEALGPAARDVFVFFKDLCLLGNGERPHFLQLEYLSNTFTLELIKSVLTNYYELFRKVSLLPFAHPRPVCQQLSLNHSHFHSIPSS